MQGGSELKNRFSLIFSFCVRSFVSFYLTWNPLLFFNVLQIYDIADLSEVHFVNFFEITAYIIS